jgi:transposase-like protein
MKFEQYLKEEKFDIKKLKCAECDSTNLVMKNKKIFCKDCGEFVKAY